LTEKNNSFAMNRDFSRINPVQSRFDIFSVPEYADEIFINEKLKENN